MSSCSSMASLKPLVSPRTCRENCPDEVHGLFSIPSTTVEIQDLIFNETPLVVRTCGPHRFKTGQIVLLTGIKAKTGAPSQLQALVEGLSRGDQVARRKFWVGNRLLPGTGHFEKVDPG